MNFDQSGFGTGRAGMQYRDLIPDRFGGRFIASHIRISDGGPVPDYVHHHDIQFQMIFCVNGWVRVVYEDQGEPMLMEAGDCFLQPPHIRHRVLECSDQMEVVEFASPAEHETSADHSMELPTSTLDRERDFSGQKFVFHKASQADWSPSLLDGFELQDTGISNATDGVASVLVIRSTGNAADALLSHDAGIRFLFVLGGEAVFTCESENHRVLSKGDSCAIPPGLACSLVEVSPDFRMLDVSIPSHQEGRSSR
jgi:quercetin dioxygenase-like cupin family protein